MISMVANLTSFDLAGFIGVVMIVIAYLLLQLDKLPSSSLSYSLLNAAGALLIIISLIFKFNLSAFIVEVFWFLISLLGLTKSFVSRKNPPVHCPATGPHTGRIRPAANRWIQSAFAPVRCRIARIVFPQTRRIAENRTKRTLRPDLKVAQHQRHQWH